MAVIYEINKKKDKYILEVSQDSSYTLSYISNNVSTVIKTADIITGSETLLDIIKDGEYLVKIEAVNETAEEKTLNVISFLQKSINIDIYNLLCDVSCKDNLRNKCITEEAKTLIKTKNVFSKILIYYSLYLPSYGEDYLNGFGSYLKEAIKLSKCNIQNIINNIVEEECTSLSSSYKEKLFKTQLFIYWAGFYFAEKSTISPTNTSELEFLKSKTFYDKIVSCACSVCIDIAELEALFLNNATKPVEIYSFQFDGATLGVADLETIITDDYLTNTALLQEEDSLLAGKNINYTLLGRTGFAIKTTNQNPYNIIDILGNNVAFLNYDKVYNATREILFFVSKNFATPSTIYFKFEKI